MLGGKPMVRVQFNGRTRRLSAPRVAWIIATSAYPRAPRPSGSGKGGRASSLQERAKADAALLAAMAAHPGATLRRLASEANSTEPSVCERLKKLAAAGLTVSPQCTPTRWALTGVGAELAASAPVLLDDTDRDLLKAVARRARTPTALAAAMASVSCPTALRRLRAMKDARLVSNGDAWSITPEGLAAISGPDAPRTEPWLRREAVAASSAKDVLARDPADDRTKQERKRMVLAAIQKGRETARINRSAPFNPIAAARS